MFPPPSTNSIWLPTSQLERFILLTCIFISDNVSHIHCLTLLMVSHLSWEKTYPLTCHCCQKLAYPSSLIFCLCPFTSNPFSLSLLLEKLSFAPFQGMLFLPLFINYYSLFRSIAFLSGKPSTISLSQIILIQALLAPSIYPLIESVTVLIFHLLLQFYNCPLK